MKLRIIKDTIYEFIIRNVCLLNLCDIKVNFLLITIKKYTAAVVLMGSVRKGGNTDLLVQAFAEGAEKNNTVEIISAADYKVNPCIGCNTCFEREGNRCFQEDEMQEIYGKLKEADVLAIASPVYFYGAVRS